MEYYTNSRDDEEDSKVGDDGQFVALASVSGEDEIYLELNDKEKKKPKEGRKKKQKQHKTKQAQLLKDELNPAIEKKGSNDSAQFQRRTCGDMFSQIFGINPSDVVVKVLAYARPYHAKKEDGICEPLPLKGTPQLVMVGKIMSKTPDYCPVKFGDRVMAFLDDKFHSDRYAKLPFQSLFKLKKNLEPWQQVSIVLSYLPALQALQTAPFTVEANKVLLNGGLGPVNQALIHLCLLHGAKKVYVPVEGRQAGIVRGFGARPVGPRHVDWSRNLIDTIDIVIESIGENSFITSSAMLVDTGHMIVLGASSMDKKNNEFLYPLKKMLVDMKLKASERASIFDFGNALGTSLSTDRETFMKDFKYLDKMVWEGTLPVINSEIAVAEEGSMTSIVDGFEIVTIPPENEWDASLENEVDAEAE